MSFRKYGGITRASKLNIINSNLSSFNNCHVVDYIGDNNLSTNVIGNLKVSGFITAKTPELDDNSQKVATTEWVRNYIANVMSSYTPTPYNSRPAIYAYLTKIGITSDSSITPFISTRGEVITYLISIGISSTNQSFSTSDSTIISNETEANVFLSEYLSAVGINP